MILEMDASHEARLAAARTEIDDIDRQVLGLIARRSGLAAQLAAAKAMENADASPIRPAREIQLLRRLLSYGSVEPELVIEIWRALIGANLRRQGPLEAAVAGSPDPVRLHDVARRHFGAGAKIHRCDDARAALTKALEQRGVVAVLPWPGAGAGAWWPTLNETRFQALALVSALPLRAESGQEPEAAIIARGVTAEAAGGDETFAVVFDPHYRLARTLAEAGLPGREAARARELALIRFTGFLTADDPRIPTLFKAGLDGFRIVGSFARV